LLLIKATHQDVICVMDVAGQFGFVNVNISTKVPPEVISEMILKFIYCPLSYLKPHWGVAILWYLLSLCYKCSDRGFVAKLLEKLLK
jgi:hypothetical protein